jgi:LysM repeat protein
MVIAWCILPIAMGFGSHRADHPAQATISIASSTQPTPADQPGTLMTVTAAQVPAGPAATWTVRPGDTLSSIAAALALPGGWQALYAANQRVIGPNPDLIRAGTILVTPGSAARTSAARTSAARKKAPAAAAGSGRHQAQPRATASHRKVRQLPGSPGALTISAGRTASAAVMPRWLQDALLATGLLLVIAFAVEPALAIGRRRRRTARVAQERAAGESAAQQVATRQVATRQVAAQEFATEQSAAQEFAAQEFAVQERAAVKTARFVEAPHDRLIVTYCARDDTVYLLTPPGEDPRAVLRAARLVLPEDTYEELAGHLGVPSGWPGE